MIGDRASFHRTNDLNVSANMTLIPLPPSYRELNSIENLWHYLRSHCCSNRPYKGYDQLFDVPSSSWCQYDLDIDWIKPGTKSSPPGPKATSQHASTWLRTGRYVGCSSFQSLFHWPFEIGPQLKAQVSECVCETIIRTHGQNIWLPRWNRINVVRAKVKMTDLEWHHRPCVDRPRTD